MAQCATEAGFRRDKDNDSNPGTYDEQLCYSIGPHTDEEAEEIDWFPRFCAQGFRGMTAWLKKQVAK